MSSSLWQKRVSESESLDNFTPTVATRRTQRARVVSPRALTNGKSAGPDALRVRSDGRPGGDTGRDTLARGGVHDWEKTSIRERWKGGRIHEIANEMLD